MAYEERRVVETDPVATEPVETVEPATTVETVRREPTTVVERRPRTTIVHDDDPIANAYAASQLVQTIIWAIVVLVLLVVALLALHVYAHLF
jgi:hypothetical protein